MIEGGAKIGAVAAGSPVLKERVMISGAESLAPEAARRRNYQTKWPALVPKTERRALTPAEENAFTTDRADSRQHIIVVKISDEGLKAINQHRPQPPEVDVKPSPMIELMPGVEAKLVSVTPAEGNLLTGARMRYAVNQYAEHDPDFPEGGFMGLHFDRENLFPLSKRLDDTRRILVNLGPNPRYSVVVVPETIFDTAREERRSDKDWADWSPRSTDLLPAIGRRADSLKVLWTKIMPGEAYVLPAHVLFHDGSTFEEGPSTTAFLREPDQRWDPQVLAEYSVFNQVLAAKPAATNIGVTLSLPTPTP